MIISVAAAPFAKDRGKGGTGEYRDNEKGGIFQEGPEHIGVPSEDKGNEESGQEGCEKGNFLTFQPLYLTFFHWHCVEKGNVHFSEQSDEVDKDEEEKSTREEARPWKDLTRSSLQGF